MKWNKESRLLGSYPPTLSVTCIARRRGFHNLVRQCSMLQAGGI
jgi:hypothetical protein